jgi:hypothetical protein
MFGQLCAGFPVGLGDGAVAGDLDGVLAVVVADVDGVLPCVAAMATVAAPAPNPPARTAVTAARRSSTPLSDGITASLPERAASRPAVRRRISSRPVAHPMPRSHRLLSTHQSQSAVPSRF